MKELRNGTRDGFWEVSANSFFVQMPIKTFLSAIMRNTFSAKSFGSAASACSQKTLEAPWKAPQNTSEIYQSLPHRNQESCVQRMP
jgi:hypothetical protein